MYQKKLHDRMQGMHKDIDAHDMWKQIKRGDLKELYVIFSTSHLPTGGLHLTELPHLLLSDIIRLTSKGDKILLEDFH